MVRDLLKSVPPTALVVAGVVVFACTLASITVLSITGTDTAEFYRFLNLIMNGGIFLLSTGSLVAAGASAKRASNVEHKMENGFKHEVAEEVKHQLIESSEVEVTKNHG